MNSDVTTQQSSQDSSPDEYVVSIEDLRKSYGDEVAVDGISFDIEPGSVVGLLGPNGAGKTTTIKMMLGSVVPDDGSIEVFGTSVGDNPKHIHNRIGMMFEGSRDAYWRLTVRENLEFFTRLNGIPATHRQERHDELLDRLDLSEKADVPVRKLSRGMKQKVAIASTLSQDIELAVLDEPTLGLDVDTSRTLQNELRDLVQAQDLTVIITSHDMNVIENICDRVIILSDGSVLADDSVERLLAGFEEDTYRITLDSTSPHSNQATLQALQSKSGVEIVEYDENNRLLEVTFSDGDLHELSSIIRGVGGSVRSLSRVTPDLEEVFLEVTNDG